MPTNYLSVLYKHIIQVEIKNIPLPPPPPSKKWGGGHMPPCPPRFLRQWYIIYIYIYKANRHFTHQNSVKSLPPIGLKFQIGPNNSFPLLRTESLAMPEAVPASGRVWTLNGYRHVNTVSQFPVTTVMLKFQKNSKTSWNIIEVEPFDGGSVVVWGGICGEGYVGRRELRWSSLTDSSALHRWHSGAIYQHDNRQSHSQNRTQLPWANNVNVLTWLAFSPDTSPIEHLWDVTNASVGQHRHAPANQHELIQARGVLGQEAITRFVSDLSLNFSDSSCAIRVHEFERLIL